MVHDRLPHGTAAGAKGLLVADNDALLLGPGDGHVYTGAVKHEAGQLATSAAANRRYDDHVRIRPLAGVDLRFKVCCGGRSLGGMSTIDV